MRFHKLRFVWALLAFVAFSNRGNSAIAPELPGVFAVMQPASLGYASKVGGTAFLVDSESGLFLTAAHVIRDLKLSDRDASIELRLRLNVGRGPYSLRTDIPLRTHVVACKYDYVGRGDLPSQDDWALLKLAPNGDRDLLDIYKPVVLKFDLTTEVLGRLAFRPNSVIQTWGFPAEGLLLQDVRLAPDPADDQLWRASGRVVEGSSGGPCMLFEDGEWVLVGIVLLRRAPPGKTDGVSHLILPCCTFLPELARYAPETVNVKDIMSFLRRSADINAADLDLHRARVYRAMQRLTGIEHWQLRYRFCEDPTAPDSEIAKFIFTFYSAFGHPEFAIGLLRCRPQLIASMATQARQISKLSRSSERGVHPDQLLLATRVAEAVMQDVNTFERHLSPEMMSCLMTDYVYCYERLNPTDKEHNKSLMAVEIAARYDASNPDLASSVALAKKSLSVETRLGLTYDLVTTKAAAHRNGVMLEVHPTDNKLVFDRIWRNVAPGTGGVYDVDEIKVTLPSSAMDRIREIHGGKGGQITRERIGR